MIIVRNNDGEFIDFRDLTEAATYFYDEEGGIDFTLAVEVKRDEATVVTDMLEAMVTSAYRDAAYDREHERYEGAARNFLRGAA